MNFTTIRELCARSWVRRGLLPVPVLMLTALFIVTELRGIDFGYHWDELDWHIKPVREMISGGVFLPRAYIYPSLSKWLVLLPAIQKGLGVAWEQGLEPRAIQAAMIGIANQPDYLLMARRVFAVVSALGVVWIYAAALVLRRHWWEALIAACGLGLSWEFAYHARWLANDCLVVQFAALMLLMLALFERTRRAGWLYGAAIAAGLATSTKYPGVVLLVPVLILGALALPVRAVGTQVARLIGLCAVAGGAYLVTSPGTLLDPFVFLTDAHRITTAYSTGHFGYTVHSTGEHWKLAVTYLTFSYFSPWKPVAVILTAGAFWGAVVWLRSERRFGAVLVAFPLAFLTFFCAKYRVVIIRNYLLIAPFLVLLLARGVGDVAARLRWWWLRALLLSACGAVAIAQAVFLIRAGESIRHPEPSVYVPEAVAYIAGHPRQRFRVSPKVRALAAEQHLALPANITDGPADAVVFQPISEGPSPWSMKTNDAWFTEAVFGPREMNFNWYTTWGGHDRIVVMTTEKARATKVTLAR